MNSCTICDRIQQIKNGSNPYLVKELESGYVVLGDHQFYQGYTFFLYKNHVEELHELNIKEKSTFLNEMAIVAEAVYKSFTPKKLNYELLGNTDKHLHWHIFPRYKNDPRPNLPVWVIDKNVRQAEDSKPSPDMLQSMKAKLFKELALLI